MPEYFKAKRLVTAPTPGAVNAGDLSFVKNTAGNAVQGYVTGTNGIPLPFITGESIKWLFGPGVTPPNPPDPDTMYVNVLDKVIYFSDQNLNILVHPITEGSILANVYYSEAPTPVSATGNTPTSVLVMSETFDPGVYLIDIQYGWTCDSTGRDAIIEFLKDGSPAAQPHEQEPQDAAGSVAWTNTNQTQTGSKRFIADFTGGGSHSIEVTMRSDANNVEVSMFDVTIVAWNLTGLA